MQHAIAYGAALIVFGVVDLAWLVLMGSRLYRPTLGDILLPSVRLWPAMIFYLVFPVGILVFAVLPGLRGGSLASTFGLGLLLGAVAYATYDLTNFATVRNWTLQLTVIDIVYGALVTGVAAVAATEVSRFFD
jgi:uncharacterized membrane protein